MIPRRRTITFASLILAINKAKRPAAPGEGPSNRCLIFGPEPIRGGNDARDAKVYSVSFGWQKTRANDPLPR